MLDFRLDTFIAVCKHMNFTHAAHELNITQPAVSQHIKYLQEEYEITLFEHVGKKITLTKDGEYLLNVATTLKHDDLFLHDYFKRQKTKKLAFGATQTIGEYVILDKIVNYMKKHPTRSLSITFSNTESLLEKLNTGELDVAMVTGYFSKAEYDYLVFTKEPYIAICSYDYPIEKRKYHIEELLQTRILLREQGAGSRDILERYLKERNYSFDDFTDSLEINNIQAIVKLVEAGCGISFVYKKAVEKHIKAKKVKEIKMEDFSMVHDLCMVWRKNSIFASSYVELFEKLIDREEQE